MTIQDKIDVVLWLAMISLALSALNCFVMAIGPRMALRGRRMR